jgi:hypothetical protein
MRFAEFYPVYLSQHPFYSFMGDWVMWKDMLSGRIRP